MLVLPVGGILIGFGIFVLLEIFYGLGHGFKLWVRVYAALQMR